MPLCIHSFYFISEEKLSTSLGHCLISFENPPGFFKQNSSHVYLMLPWLSNYQFHAFTVFPSTEPNLYSICFIHKCGDCIGKLIGLITTPTTHKPYFVVPFLSPKMLLKASRFLFPASLLA